MGANLFSEFLKNLTKHGFTARIVGELVVNTGDVGIGNKLFNKCSCMGVSATGVSYECQSCGRAPGNYFWMQSGDGAGEFPIIELRARSSELMGALVIFDSPYASSPTLQDQLAVGQLAAYEDFDLAKLRGFGELKTLDFGTLGNSGEIYISEVRKLHNQAPTRYSLSQLNAGVVGVYAFCEPMGRSDDKRKGNPIKVSDPFAPRPRILAVMTTAMADQMKLSGQYLVEDWSSQVLVWRSSFVSTVSEADSDSEEAEAEQEVTPADLAKPSIGLNGGTSKVGSSTPGQFCIECGTRFANETAKFCSDCGTSRIGASAS
jgi:hypothetical protein